MMNQQIKGKRRYFIRTHTQTIRAYRQKQYSHDTLTKKKLRNAGAAIM